MWAVKLGEMAKGLGRIAASGPGAPIAAVVMGMMPGRLNDGEQDYLDRVRLAQLHNAPSRVRYTWEQDAKGNLTPHGWHTPPGKDRMRVRKMEWDKGQQAYTFTTEEDNPVTIIWTPDSSGVNVPANTGNQNPVKTPNPVVVDPLPEDTTIEATTIRHRKRGPLRIIFLSCRCRIYRRYMFIQVKDLKNQFGPKEENYAS